MGRAASRYPTNYMTKMVEKETGFVIRVYVKISWDKKYYSFDDVSYATKGPKLDILYQEAKRSNTIWYQKDETGQIAVAKQQ